MKAVFDPGVRDIARERDAEGEGGLHAVAAGRPREGAPIPPRHRAAAHATATERARLRRRTRPI